MEEKADVCVIGSGAGGAVFARELAVAGKRVIILEAGGKFSKANHGESIFDASIRIFRETRAFRFAFTIGLPPIQLMFGSCVGGSTALNAGTCFRIPERVLDKWKRVHGLEEFGFTRMNMIYNAIESFLPVTEVTPDIMGGSGRVFKRGIEALRWSGGPVKRNANGCRGCGMCVIGCPNDAKKAMHLSYLPDAIRHGAKLYLRTRAEKILVKNGRVEGVEAVRRSDATKQERLVIKTPVVSLSAGAINSPILLQKNRLANSSGMVGKNFHLHPGIAIGAIFDEDISCWKGVPQSYYSDEFIDEGLIFLVGAVPPPIGSAMIPGFGHEHKSLMASYRGFTDAGVLVSDRSRGIVRPGVKGIPLITYKLERNDLERLRFGAGKVMEIYLAAGAKSVFPVYTGTKVVHNRRDIPEVLSGLNRWRFIGGSLHPMGTCIMGRKKGNSVVNPFCESHDIKGLFINDASVFPTSIAVNPQEAIMALSKHSADYLNENSDRYF